MNVKVLVCSHLVIEFEIGFSKVIKLVLEFVRVTGVVYQVDLELFHHFIAEFISVHYR